MGDKVKRIAFLVVCLMFLVGCKDEVKVSNTEVVKTNEMLMVEIKGAVKYPGIYEVESGSIIKDIIDLAGGVLAYANLSEVNLVKKLEDNQLIVIPTIKEISTKININNASIDELTMIEGIGSTKAKAIVKYRNEVGVFTSIDDLKKVSGISSNLFEKIKAFITV